MADYLPIRELSTYRKDWTICGRVTNKTPVRTFGKAGSKVFSVDILDGSGVEIRASFFNQAVDSVFDKLQKGRCYTFSKGNVRVAKQQFNNTSHKYELAFEKFWQVEDAADDGQIQSFNLAVTSVGAIKTRNTPCKVDLCGVVVDAAPAITVTSKDGVELSKREITVADDSGCSMMVVLWAAKAALADDCFRNNPVVGLKKVFVKEWHGARAGSLLPEGELVFNPDVPEALKVRQWWASGGCSQSLEALTQTTGGGGEIPSTTTVNHAELREAVAQTTRMQVFVVFSRLHAVQMSRQGEPMSFYYRACQEDKGQYICSRRTDEGGFCASCNRIVKTALKMNIRCHYSDAFDSNWIGTFHDPAAAILDIDVEEAAEREREQGGREALEASIQARYYYQPLQLMVRAKMDEFNGQPRINVGVIDAMPVDLGERGRDMLQEIDAMLEE